MKSIALVLMTLVLSASPLSQEAPKPKRIDITITADGFTPASVTAEPNVAIELVFTRTTDNTCANEVVIPDLKIKKPLPLKEPVSIVFTPKGETTFACGMNMLKGKVVVK
jgi:plastocyanin domain-containing protein